MFQYIWIVEVEEEQQPTINNFPNSYGDEKNNFVDVTLVMNSDEKNREIRKNRIKYQTFRLSFDNLSQLQMWLKEVDNKCLLWNSDSIDTWGTSEPVIS